MTLLKAEKDLKIKKHLHVSIPDTSLKHLSHIMHAMLLTFTTSSAITVAMSIV